MLPQIILICNKPLVKRARKCRITTLRSFDAGLLDSFSLVEFVTLLETEFGFKVSDAELRPETFDTIAKIEAYVANVGAAV